MSHLKAAIHYCSWVSPDVFVNAKSQSQSADFEQLTDLTENHEVYKEHRLCFLLSASDYDFIQLEDISHVWYFETILGHILLYVSHFVYDAQFFSGTIYTVDVCVVSSVSKSVQIISV